MGPVSSPRRPGESVPPQGRMPQIIPVTAFGKYTFVARLGRGGMAEVFLAFVAGPAGFRKPLVIKRILPDLAAEPRLVDMFFDEARLAARLSHPHVVQTYEVGVIDGSHFLAMEYLEGQPFHQVLKQALHAGKRVPDELIARVIADVLDGLHYAHELRDFDGSKLGVVHRDISPQNIFVTYDGVVKVLDFGIAKAATQVVETRTGAIKGKYAYMAPEQAKATDIDCRADVWGVGVVLWEALVGKRLFKADSDFATLEHTLRGPIPSLDDARSDASPMLKEVLDRALVRKRDQRYPTAQAMREDLEDYLRSLPAPVSRNELAAYMKELFGDMMTEHRSLLASCMTSADEVIEESRVRSASGYESRPGSSRSPRGDGTVPERPSRVRTQSNSGVPAVRTRAPERRTPYVSLLLLFLVLSAGAAAIAFWVPMGARDSRERVVPEAIVPARVQPREDAPSQETSAPDIVPDTHRTVPQDAPENIPSSPEDVPGTPQDVTPERVPSDVNPIPRNPRTPRVPRHDATSEATAEVGRLSFNTIPWSKVSIRGRYIGDTPIQNLELPAGPHTLSLYNPEQEIRQDFSVTIPAGGSVSRSIRIGEN